MWVIWKNPSQPDNDHTSRIKGGERQAGETRADQKGSLRTNTNPCVCSWWSRELHIGGGLEMTVIGNGTLGRCSAPGLARQGTAQTARQDGEVNVCFQSACGFLGKVISTTSRQRGMQWGAAQKQDLETRNLQNPQALRRTAPGKGRQQAKTESVLKLISTSHQQVHFFVIS